MNKRPKRKRIRLHDFDYASPNYYYVTLCTHEKKYLFGMTDHLTQYGKVADLCFGMVNEVFPNVTIDKYVIMPNHIHAIVVIENEQADRTARMYACPTLGTVIGNYKAAVSRKIHAVDPSIQVWQTRFYDHVIRDQKDYENIWTYIDENPVKWESDDYY